MGYGIAPPVPPYAHPRPHFRTFQLIPHLGNWILIKYFHFVIDFQTKLIFPDPKIIIYGVSVKPIFLGPFLGMILNFFQSVLWYFDVSGHSVCTTSMFLTHSRSLLAVLTNVLLEDVCWFRLRVTMPSHLIIVIIFEISRTVLVLVLLAIGEGTPSKLRNSLAILQH